MYAEYKNVPIHGVLGEYAEYEKCTRITRNVHGLQNYKLMLGVQAFYNYDTESP